MHSVVKTESKFIHGSHRFKFLSDLIKIAKYSSTAEQVMLCLQHHL